MAFQVAEKLENLVENGRFYQGLEGWEITGGGTLFHGFSRNSTSDCCIRFASDGSATYRMEHVPGGQYSLRYYLFDRGPVKRADMSIIINGNSQLIYPLTPRGWWSEYASGPITVPDGACVSIRLEVEGGNDRTAVTDRTFESTGTEEMNNPWDICVDFDEIEFLRIPYAMPEPISVEGSASRLCRREDGTYYMEVGGKPFLCQHAHAYDLHEPDMRIRVQKLKEAGFNTFTHGMVWRNCQTAADQSDLDQIDFSTIDRDLELAEEFDMYIAFGFAGSGHCGILQGAPDYIMRDHGLHAKDPLTGECHQKYNAKDRSDMMCLADYGNPRLIELEGNVVRRIIRYIEEHDVNNRIILFKMENEPVEAIYGCRAMKQEHVAAHIDALAQIIKSSRHPMLVYVNHGFGSASHFIFNTPHIDFNGTDPYTDEMSALNKILLDNFNSRIGCLAENGGYANSAAQLAAAYARDGFVSPYPIGPDTYWDRPGLYGYDFDKKEFVVLDLTKRITAINLSCAQIGEILVRQPYRNKASFNTENEGSRPGYQGSKTLGDVCVTMCAPAGEAGVGVAVADDSAVYCAADSACAFSLDRPILSAEYGRYQDGQWITDGPAIMQDGRAVCQQNAAMRLLYKD